MCVRIKLSTSRKVLLWCVISFVVPWMRTSMRANAQDKSFKVTLIVENPPTKQKPKTSPNRKWKAVR